MSIQTKTLRFQKMQGCGNDYIYFDCFDQRIDDPAALSVRLSRPHFGVGADGIILILPSETADGRMRIFNADGSEGKMCGNGVRCVGKYLYDSGRVPKTELRIETRSGVRTLRLAVENGRAVSARVDMGGAGLRSSSLPAAGPLAAKERAVDFPILIGGRERRVTLVSMGNPHCVLFDRDPDALDIAAEGPVFEKSEYFPEGVNTEFVKVLCRNHLKMRVWERGSGETLACGTGACASAVAAVLNGHCDKDADIAVDLPGGRLIIRYSDETVYMTGPAETVFTGEVQA